LPRNGSVSQAAITSPRSPQDVQGVAPFPSQIASRQTTEHVLPRNGSVSQAAITSPRSPQDVQGVAAAASSLHSTRPLPQQVYSRSACHLELQEVVVHTLHSALRDDSIISSKQISSAKITFPPVHLSSSVDLETARRKE
jgi:hypothetical protein